jgi:hypothetical protein
MVSTAAEKIKANAERLRQKPSTSTAAPASDDVVPREPEASPSIESRAIKSQPVVRQKTVRRTVDLSPTAHRGLDSWQSATADRLGLARVTGQDVLAALVDRLLADSELANQIVQTIAEQRS